MKKSFILTFKQTILSTLIASCVALPAGAAETAVGQMKETDSVTTDKEKLPMRVRISASNENIGFPNQKSLIRIPEVTMDGHTLHFVTPCTGLTLQLVQADEVCYETVITSDYLEIPADFTGTYELQILRGEYVFYAEVEL